VLVAEMKHGRWWDSLLMQRLLGGGPAKPLKIILKQSVKKFSRSALFFTCQDVLVLFLCLP